MDYLARLFLIVISLGALCAQNQQNPNAPLADNPNPISASSDVYLSEISPYCVERTSGNPNNIFPTGQSVENFIALVERLELLIANDSDTNLRQHIGADNVAKLFLRRFRFDGYDPDSSGGSGPPQKSRDRILSETGAAVLTPSAPVSLPQNYYFPNKFFSQAELCSLYYMLSHNIYDITSKPRVAYSQGFRARSKRQAYRQNQNQNQNQQNPYNNQQNQYNNQWQQNRPNRNWADTNRDTVSPFLRKTNYAIKEEGVASFRGHPEEAIQLSRVLIGVIAGLSSEAKQSASDVLHALRPSYALPAEYDKPIDYISMVTLADLYGVTSRIPNDNSNRKYIYGSTGRWTDQSCTTHYGLESITPTDFNNTNVYIQATKAEIRGGLDGYKIGKALNAMGRTADQIKLSTILRSYYNKPQSQGATTSAFTVSYCDRISNININDIEAQATLYAAIVAKANGMSLPPNLIQDFKTAFQSAQNPERDGFNDYCTIPGNQYDATAPCETPSDVLYFIDGSSLQKLSDSAKIVTLLNGNLNNIRSEGGTVSIFLNSAQKSTPNPEVVLPIGTGSEQWPFAVAAFNMTSTGCAQCRISDFNTTTPAAVANTGKYFRYLNATLMDYEWWTPRTNQSWIPAKSAVLIDFDSVAAAPDNGQDRNDYNWYKDQLRSRHRDVYFLSLANNLELFKDIVRDYEKDRKSPNSVDNEASALAKRICDNPATFQYNMCNQRASSNLEIAQFITPGYKQNWAMYPEFFLKSFNIKFNFKALDGNIRVCFDRTFPPNRNEWCKDSNDNPEIVFEINNPCKGRSFDSCDPFYFTVWGKERNTGSQCTDPRCLNLNQIKWSVTHTGVQCSSSHHLLPSMAFQVISVTLFAILYLFFNN